jgi:hypothetical protein
MGRAAGCRHPACLDEGASDRPVMIGWGRHLRICGLVFRHTSSCGGRAGRRGRNRRMSPVPLCGGFVDCSR